MNKPFAIVTVSSGLELATIARKTAAVFFEVNKPKPAVLLELARGWLTGARVEAGETHTQTEPRR